MSARIAEMRFLAVIPARSGSVGVPDKNVRPLRGRPMFAYTLDHLSEVPGELDIAVSTDSERYAGLFRDWASRDGQCRVVPFIRPPEMCSGSLPATVAMKHVLPHMEERCGARYDAVIMACPNVPIRPRGIFERLLARLWEPDAPDSVSCLCPLDYLSHPQYQMGLSATGEMIYRGGKIPGHLSERQQSEPSVYRLSACGYVFRRETVMQYPLTTPDDVHAAFGARRAAVVHAADECVEMDDPGDLEWAEFLLTKRGG